MRICVYCASSNSCSAEYHHVARDLGRRLALAGHEIVYGGGARGSMGALADGALGAGGKVHGVLPHFMSEIEWGHRGLTGLELVDDMRTRKHRMLEDAHGVIALPGGSGTLEELFEALTLKRLGLLPIPIVLVDTNGYYAQVEALLLRCIEERFMAREHQAMWQRVPDASAALTALTRGDEWPADALRFAAT
jgi:uncharacterized protein (TIGR00730 family)